MDIKGFKTKDGVIHKYDHEALANIPEVPSLAGYATEKWVGENYQPKGNYLTEVPDGYAKTEDIPTDKHINELIDEKLDSGGNADYVVQDTEPEDTSVLWVDPSDNSDDGFQEAVNAALAQAKESGEFDGPPGKNGADGQPGKDGADGKDYVMTSRDWDAISELAVRKIEVTLDERINKALGVVENGSY